MLEILSNLNLAPFAGIAFVSWVFYLDYKKKRNRDKEKIELIEKGIDPSLLYSKPNIQQISFKIGLLLIGSALGVLIGYILNSTLGIPNFVAYSTMILLICGIILVYIHKSRTE